MAKNTIRALIEMPNTIFSTVYFYLNLIENDSDDNKFVDCAFATNADYLVTNNKDFNVLKKIDFPRIKVVTIDEFKDILISFN